MLDKGDHSSNRRPLKDVVIVLYVIDLGWMVADRLKQQWQSRHAKF
jgi:hypothetical protein